MLDWLEITPDYRCNNRCLGCFSAQDGGPSMSPREMLEALSRAHRDGARSLWLGGGEPTMRRDLFALVSAARKLGYTRVKLQTNGMMLAYPEFARRCADAGVTEVSFSVKGATEEMHDRLAQTPGCHALMVQGMEQVRALGLGLEADLLVYKSNVGTVPEMVRAYAPRGVAHFRVWLLSAMDRDGDEVRAEVPRVSEAARAIVAAMDLGLSTRPDFISSLHTPPCTVPGSHHACLFDAAALNMLVSNPGGFAFKLEASPIEGGHYLPRCDGCKYRPRCRGLRADYLRLHGDAEFRPPE